MSRLWGMHATVTPPLRIDAEPAGEPNSARPPLRLVEADPVDELTPREREVLALMARGLSNAAICGTLFISPKTLERHVQNVFLKLGLPPSPHDHRRVRAVLMWLRSPLSGQPLTAKANP
jgi:DNA-binding NarL/FixJ family response regulator